MWAQLDLDIFANGLVSQDNVGGGKEEICRSLAVDKQDGSLWIAAQSATGAGLLHDLEDTTTAASIVSSTPVEKDTLSGIFLLDVTFQEQTTIQQEQNINDRNDNTRRFLRGLVSDNETIPPTMMTNLTQGGALDYHWKSTLH